AKDPMLLGSDNWPVEVAPNPDPQISLPVHQIALVVNGVHLLENLKLDELAAKQVYEFALILQPLKMQGATGSTAAPSAARRPYHGFTSLHLWERDPRLNFAAVFGDDRRMPTRIGHLRP